MGKEKTFYLIYIRKNLFIKVYVINIDYKPIFYDSDVLVCFLEIDEYEFLQEALEDTKEDIVRYNHSFAGVLATASNSTDLMNDEITDILSKIQNAEGLELLSEIKNVVG
mgnify:CR=1 FL=1